jgi:serine phosphatase RsbU (regulator of sigma subunit)
MSDVHFDVSTMSGAPGDVLVILTDGLTEIADSSDCELGLEPLKSVLAGHAGDSLPELAKRLRARALDHGPQVDDQTLLLVRYS